MSQASLYTILNNATTKTYVTGITIYNTLTRFICATMFNIHFSNKFFTKYSLLNTRFCNVTNNWIHIYYLHDLQKKQLSLHKSFICCQACSCLIYSTYNLVNCLNRNVIKSCFTIDNIPNQINRLVGFHSDFSTLGTKPLLIKSHFT